MDEHVLEIEFGPDTRAAGDVRRAVAPWLSERAFPAELLGDLLVVVSELVTNAVVHTRASGRVTVRWNGRRPPVKVTPPASVVPGATGITPTPVPNRAGEGRKP